MKVASYSVGLDAKTHRGSGSVQPIERLSSPLPIVPEYLVLNAYATPAHPSWLAFYFDLVTTDATTGRSLGNTLNLLLEQVHVFAGSSGGALPALVQSLRRAEKQTIAIDPAVAVNEIRVILGLSISALADVLCVGRPAIYAWLKQESRPKVENEQRINLVHELALQWKRVAPADVVPNLRAETSSTRSLIEDLSSPQLDVELIRDALIHQASHGQQPPALRVLDSARRASLPATPATEFDRLTNRPLGPID